MNIYHLTNIIHATTQEQRDRVFEEIHNKPIGDEALCRYYECKRKGEGDIEISVGMRGPINEEIYDILDLPLEYPGVTEEEWKFTECWLDYHRIRHQDHWEDIWTIDDAIELCNASYIDFDPSMLELKTFRKVHKDGKLQLDESEIVSYPIEMMDDHIREEYEKWKEDPVAWEEEREEAAYRLKHPKDNDDDDDLPF